MSIIYSFQMLVSSFSLYLFSRFEVLQIVTQVMAAIRHFIFSIKIITNVFIINKVLSNISTSLLTFPRKPDYWQRIAETIETVRAASEKA